MTSEVFNHPPLDRQDVEALKALNQGTASADQQRLALYVIVNKLSRAHDVLYLPGSFDESAFLSGRGFVGQKILKYIKIPIGKLNEIKESVNHE